MLHALFLQWYFFLNTNIFLARFVSLYCSLTIIILPLTNYLRDSTNERNYTLQPHYHTTPKPPISSHLRSGRIPFDDSPEREETWTAIYFWKLLMLVFNTSLEIYAIYAKWVGIGRDSSVGIVTDYGLDDHGSIPDRGRFFLFSTASRTRNRFRVHPTWYTMGARG
jgi:hypothetical protein